MSSVDDAAQCMFTNWLISRVFLFRQSATVGFRDVQIPGVFVDCSQKIFRSKCLELLAVALFTEAGKLHALAVTGAERSTVAPGIPTVADAGAPDY